MSTKTTLFATLFAASIAGSALAADSVPYPNRGTYNPTWIKFVATGAGPVSAYFVGTDSKYTENLGVFVNGNLVSPGFGAPSNRSLKRGQRIDFGTVKAGDTVALFLSIPSVNRGILSQKTPIEGGPATPNGIYVANFPGDAAASIPAGTYVGWEDEIDLQKPDFDYNDSEYVFTNLTPILDN